MKLRRMAPLVVACGIAGCGSSNSGSHSISNVSVSPSQVSGGKLFSAPGILIHFDYPAKLHPIQLQASKRVSGNTSTATHAAIGTGRYDLIVVTRFPNRPVPVTSTNIGSLKAAFDGSMSSTFGRAITGTVTSIGGLPALAYSQVPVSGLHVSATSRVTLVFVADDEYELNCQYTSAGRAAITAACNQMLGTVSK